MLRCMRMFLALGLAVLASGCEVFTHSCTEIGCLDGVTLELTPGGGTFADGNYTLELIAETTRSACRFAIPDSTPSQGTVGTVDCDLGLDAFIQQAAECTEMRTADAVSESCRPLPGQFTLNAQLQATPETLAVRLVRDGVSLVEQTLTPAYETSRPNGPDCDPECRQAQVSLELP
jgi:hypothetical protein